MKYLLIAALSLAACSKQTLPTKHVTRATALWGTCGQSPNDIVVKDTYPAFTPDNPWNTACSSGHNQSYGFLWFPTHGPYTAMETYLNADYNSCSGAGSSWKSFRLGMWVGDGTFRGQTGGAGQEYLAQNSGTVWFDSLWQSSDSYGPYLYMIAYNYGNPTGHQWLTYDGVCWQMQY